MTDKVEVTSGEYKGKKGYLVHVGEYSYYASVNLGWWLGTRIIPTIYLKKINNPKVKE